MRRSCLHLGILVCFLAGCQHQHDSRSETGRPAAVDSLVEHQPAPIGSRQDSVTRDEGGSPAQTTPHVEPESTETAGEGNEATLDQARIIRDAEQRFRQLDKNIALLEVRVFERDLGHSFEDAVSRLYHLRNDVALSLAQVETAPADEFEMQRDELIHSIEELDRRIELLNEAIYDAGDNPDVGVAERIWL